MTDNRTLAEKAARRKLNLLELASELDNVSKVCRILGYSREQFYEIRRNFQTFGSEDLLDKAKGAKSPHPNRVCEELEKAVLKYSFEQYYKDNNIKLTEQHVTLLEKFDPEFRERHIKADCKGQLVALDTFFVGNLKGIGKIYLQTVVDCHSRFAFGRLYT